ncbi:MAG: DUF4328 domain-containing protein [Pseudomonadota bacterium]
MDRQNIIRTKNLFFTALGIDIAASLVIGANSFSTIDTLKDIQSGIRTPDDALLGHIDFWDSISNLLFVTMIGVGLALVKWLNSCYRFASQTIGATGFKHESWTAVGWIIPILNLFKPYLILNEIYKAGSRRWIDGDDWKKQGGSYLLLSWWIFWAIIHLIGWVVAKQAIRDSFHDDLTLPQIIGLYEIQAWACTFSVAIAILWFIVAHGLTQRLIDRANMQPAFAAVREEYDDLPARHASTTFPAPFSDMSVSQQTIPSEPLTITADMHRDNTASQWSETDSVNEERIYEAIARELETGSIDKGLWIRLFAECNGDENRTKVLYIKQRAEKLIYNERSRLAEMARARAIEEEQLAAHHQQSAKGDALLAAVWEGNFSTVERLLREGTDPRLVVDEDGRTAHDLARLRGDEQMIWLLQTADEGVFPCAQNREAHAVITPEENPFPAIQQAMSASNQKTANNENSDRIESRSSLLTSYLVVLAVFMILALILIVNV